MTVEVDLFAAPPMLGRTTSDGRTHDPQAEELATFVDGSIGAATVGRVAEVRLAAAP